MHGAEPTAGRARGNESSRASLQKEIREVPAAAATMASSSSTHNLIRRVSQVWSLLNRWAQAPAIFGSCRNVFRNFFAFERYAPYF